MLSLLAILILILGALAFWLWPRQTNAGEDYAVLLSTGDAVQIAMVKSLLEEAQIPYLVKGDRIQDLFGVGRLGAGYNFITGPAQVLVPLEFEAEARSMLDAMTSD